MKQHSDVQEQQCSLRETLEQTVDLIVLAQRSPVGSSRQTDCLGRAAETLTKAITMTADPTVHGVSEDPSTSEKIFLVSLKRPNNCVLDIVASGVETFGEHLCFTDAKGALVELFLLEIVESWSVWKAS